MRFPYFGHLDCFFAPDLQNLAPLEFLYSLPFPVPLQDTYTLYINYICLLQKLWASWKQYMSYLSVYLRCLNSMNTYKMKVNAVYFGVSVISPKLLASPPLYSRNFAFGYRTFIRMRKPALVPPAWNKSWASREISNSCGAIRDRFSYWLVFEIKGYSFFFPTYLFSSYAFFSPVILRKMFYSLKYWKT